jgi:glutamate dehydrogenase
MADKSAQARSRLISQVMREVQKRLPEAKAKRAEVFVREFFANVPPSDLRRERPRDLAGGVLSLWEFLQQRPPGAAKVRAYNPDAERDGWETPHSVIEIINDDMPFLVDSVTAEINRQDAEVHLVVHPIVNLRRDVEGKLQGLAAATSSGAKSKSKSSAAGGVGDADPDQRTAGQAPAGNRCRDRIGAARRARRRGGLERDARPLPRRDQQSPSVAPAAACG